MSNVTVKEVQLPDGSIQEQVFIETEYGTTIMTKATYDAQLAAQEALANGN